MRLVIDNRIRMRAGDLRPETAQALKEMHSHENKHRDALRHANIRGWWQEPKVISTWQEHEGELSLPRGRARQVLELLEQHGHEVEVDDRREHGLPVDLPDSKRELFGHQKRISRTCLDHEQCLIRSPTSSGKTSALISIATAVGVPVLVIVPNTPLLDQWRERVAEELGLGEKQVGIAKGGKCKLRPITLAIQLSVTKLVRKSEDFRRYFGCVLYDEVHLAAAKTCYEAVDAMPARYRIGMSADLKRKDKKEFLLHDLFGDPLVEISREELIASGHVLDVEVVAVPTEFRADWYGVESRDLDVEETSADPKHVDIVRLVKEMAEDGERNMQIVRVVREEVRRGAQVLVAAHLREHCMRLGQVLSGMGTKTGYLLGGEESKREFQETIRGLRSGDVSVGVGTYKAIGTGIDLPRIGVGVAATPISGNRQMFNQFRGRVCRTAHGKTGARLYVMLDHRIESVFRHAKNIVAWNSVVKVADSESGSLVPARQWIREMQDQKGADDGA